MKLLLENWRKFVSEEEDTQPSLPLDHVFTVGRPSDGEIRRLPQEERIGGLTVLHRTERPETQAGPAK